MEIEEVSSEHPESIAKFYVDTAIGYSPFIGRELAFASELDPGYRKAFPAIAGALYDAFFRYGAKLVEINPLALTTDGRVIASDAKVELDDDGLFQESGIRAVARRAAARRRRAAGLAGRRRHPKLPTLSRRRRHDGQRRGSGDGDDGRGERRGRRNRELPRRRRRRQRAARPQLLRAGRQQHRRRRSSSSTSSAASPAATKWHAGWSKR